MSFGSNVAPKRVVKAAATAWICRICGVEREKHWTRCPVCGSKRP